MVKFVQVDEDVIATEMSVDSVARISRALNLLVSEYEGTDLLDDRDVSLMKVFTTASQRLAETDEPVAIED